jgi:hypothetical protein
MSRLFLAPVAVTCALVTTLPSAAANPPLSSHLIPSLDCPSDTLQICDGLRAGPFANPDGACWETGKEHWLMRRPFGEAQDWVTAQMAEIGMQPYSTYSDGPSTSWGKGTHYRVTVEMGQDSGGQTSDVYVSDINFTKGAHP